MVVYKEESESDSSSEDSGSSSSSSSSSRSSSSSSSSSDSSSSASSGKKLRMSKCSKKYLNKLKKVFISVEKKVKKAKFRATEKKMFFGVIYGNIKKMVHKEKKEIKSQPARDRRSWDYMFDLWLAYAADNPDCKNQVPLAMSKLSGWVKEQRKLFTKTQLSQDRYELLRANDFDFHPRLSARGSTNAHRSQGKLLDYVFILFVFKVSITQISFVFVLM